MDVRVLAASSILALIALSGCSDSGASIEVGIHGNAFDPSSVTFTSDDHVVFMNHEATTHTATADNGAFDSGELREGEEYDVHLEPGTYTYHCKFHSSMRGTLIVTQ
jgi:plastocyanin